MKNILKKVSGSLVKLAGKGVVVSAKALPPMLFGAAQYTKDLSSDSYYVFSGRRKKEKLIAKLNLQNSKHKLKKLSFNSDYPFADACVLSGLTASEMMMRGIPADVQEAFDKAYPELSTQTSFLESWGRSFLKSTRFQCVNCNTTHQEKRSAISISLRER